MRDNTRNQFIIIRVTTKEKQRLLDMAIESKRQFSRFIRIKLGLEKRNGNRTSGESPIEKE